MTEEYRVIKVFESFLLGICKCGCGEHITLRDSRGRLKFFKNGHSSKLQRNYFWNGGITIREGKYVTVKKPDHPNADGQGYIRLHRLVMSEHLGRPLKKGEEVHHMDGNTFNNDLSNLQLLDHNDHSAISARKDMSDRYCIECKSFDTYVDKEGYPDWYRHPITKQKWICSTCYLRIKRELRKINS